MSTPPMDEGPSDELVEAYRRASIDDPSQPSRHVREAILAQAQQSARAANAAPAANDPHGAWWAVAGRAVLGRVGLRGAQCVRSVTRPVAPGIAAIAPVTQAPVGTVPGCELRSA